MMDNAQTVISYASSTILATLAIVLAGVPSPRSRRWMKWSFSKWFMVVTFAALAVVSSLLAHAQDMVWLRTLVLGDSCLQALLLGSTTISLVAPREITGRRVVIQLVAISLLFGQLVAVQLFLPEWYYVSYTLFLIFFVFQVRGYMHCFKRSSHNTVQALYAHYDDDEASLRLKHVFHLFYSAVGLGCVMCLILIMPMSTELYTALVVLYTLFYLWVCMCMVRYRITGDYIIKIVGEPVVPDENSVEQDFDGNEAAMAAEDDGGEGTAAPAAGEGVSPVAGAASISGRYAGLEAQLSRWVEQRGYTESDVTIEQLAERMGVSRSEFITYFQIVHNTNFRSWRVRLRLEEAERMIRTVPDLQVSCLYELVGFNDRSNFHNKFVDFTGLTPRGYQQLHGPDRKE